MPGAEALRKQWTASGLLDGSDAHLRRLAEAKTTGGLPLVEVETDEALGAGLQQHDATATLNPDKRKSVWEEKGGPVLSPDERRREMAGKEPSELQDAGESCWVSN